MLRLCISISLLFAFFLHPVCVQCLGKLEKDVSLQPSNVIVTFPSSSCGDSAFVEWDPPSKAFLIESYRVTCEATDLSDRVFVVVEGDVTKVEVGPLQLDSSYRCIVISRSKIYGSSQPVASEPFSTQRSCPSPPQNVVASFSSSPPSCLNNANVSWEPSVPSNIDSYFIECVSELDSFNVTVDGDTTSALFGNLSSPLVEYTCSVRAINTAGTSEPSFASPFLTTSCPPVFVTLSLELKLEGFDTPSDFTDADKAQICLNVLTLAGLENDENTRCNVIAVIQGSVIVFIELTTTELNREQIEILAVALESSSQDVLDQLVQDLSAENVIVTVLSVEVGESDAEAPDFTVPSAVRNVRVDTSSSNCATSATVTWEAPESDGGASISKYIVFCSSATASSPPGAIVASTTRSAAIGPFNPGTFTCTVKAVNAAGANNGTESEQFVVVSCPGIPTNIRVSDPIYNGCEIPASVEIEYSPAPGTVTRYDVVCESSDGGVTARATSSTTSTRVNGLTLGKSYQCLVMAMNEAGSGQPSLPSSQIVVLECPSIPGNVAATFPFNCERAARVQWNTPTTGGMVDTFLVECQSGSRIEKVTVSGSSNAAVVTGLDISSKSYTCSVTAQNLVGSRQAASNSFTTFNPVQIPAISGGCPAGQFCRSLGNCSPNQCESNADCGGLIPVCENNECVAKCPSSFNEPATPTIENEVTVNTLSELQDALNAVTDQFTKIILDGSIELSNTLTLNKPVMLVGQNNAEIKCADSTNPNPLILLGSTGGTSISDGVVIEGVRFDRTSCSDGGRIINFRARTDSIESEGNYKIIIRDNVFIGGTDVEGAPTSEGIVTGPGNNDWIIYGNSFINLLYGLYVNVVEFAVTNEYNGVFWGNSLSTARVGVQNSWPTKELLFANNLIELNNISSFGFIIRNTVQKADFACNSISGSKEGAFIYWVNGVTSWNDIKFNYNNIEISNAAGFKKFEGGYQDDGTLPTATDGTNNYWGAADGPGGTYGAGNGALLLLDNLDYVPFLASPFDAEN